LRINLYALFLCFKIYRCVPHVNKSYNLKSERNPAMTYLHEDCTVGDLIAALNRYPSDLRVLVPAGYGALDAIKCVTRVRAVDEHDEYRLVADNDILGENMLVLSASEDLS
jgi:hypothetical protein